LRIFPPRVFNVPPEFCSTRRAENWNDGAIGLRKFDNIFCSYERIHECRQIDRRTDTQRWLVPRLCTSSHDKKSFVSVQTLLKIWHHFTDELYFKLPLLLFFVYVTNISEKQAVREAATICPRPLQVDLWLLTSKVVSESRVATSVSILVFLGLSVLDLWARCTRQTDVRRASSLNASSLWWRGHNNSLIRYTRGIQKI